MASNIGEIMIQGSGTNGAQEERNECDVWVTTSDRFRRWSCTLLDLEKCPVV